MTFRLSSLRFAHSSESSLGVALWASFNLVTPLDAPRAGRQFLRLAMPVQVLRTFPATARCALVSPASLLGAVCSHAFRRAAAGRYSLRLSMCARHCVPSAHASLREIPPCVAARRSVPPPQTRSLLLPPAAVAYLPQNDSCAVILSVSEGSRA